MLVHVAKAPGILHRIPDLSDYEIAKRLYVKAGVGWEDHTGRTKAIETSEWGLGVPVAVFVLGWCVLWAFSGFRAASVPAEK